MTRLRDIAKLVRSKNAGPFWITFDILFATDQAFDRVASAGVLTPPWIASTYNVDEAEVILALHRPARAIKFSFPRPSPQGDPGERDMYAGQQYAPVLDLEVP